MPSVGMRRSTRVFGARLLRSGRRLWTVQYDGSKYVRAANGENKWSELLDNAGGDAGNFYKDMLPENANSGYIARTAELRVGNDAMEVKNVDTMYGLVYKRRKRQRMELKINGLTDDERYGKKFARKQWRKKRKYTQSFKICGDFQIPSQELALVVTESCFDSGYWIACFLTSVLSYMSKVKIGMRRLSAFVLSRPIFDAYSSHGLLFLQDSAQNPGICRISGYSSLLPLFHVDSSALPSLFVYMQTSMHLRFSHLACVLVAHSSGVYGEVDNVMDLADDDEVLSFQISKRREHQNCIKIETQVPSVSVSCSDKAVSDNDKSRRRELSNSAGGLHKYGLRSMQLRSNRKIQKRRSSLRRKRVRPSSAFRTHRVTGALYSDVFRIRQGDVQLSPAASSRVPSSPVKQGPGANNRESKSILGLLRRDACSCTANLLVSEPDKCYREEGATVTLKSSASNQWFIAVITNETTRCLLPQKVMHPSCNNRFTHATIWNTDDGWKLEFPNKQDWWVFKELYKEGYEWNIQSSTCVIPVPGVHEVSSTKDADYLPYVRPDSYITMKDDEFIRALVNTSASYDMDSEDEVWLEKLNEELYPGKKQVELMTRDSFELIIDALEKGFHDNPDEHLDEQSAYDYCMHLERRESIDAVHNYWIRKRKHNRSALVRIFQLYQPRRAQVISKSVLRKKRSFKRQATQVGRGKQPILLQAVVAKRGVASEEQNVQKVQEAKAAAERSEGLAVVKRERAQLLMENADLATYKALMALRIAEAN